MEIQRYILKNINFSKENPRIRVLLGPRQTGKSTILRQWIESYDNVPYLSLSFDSLSLRNEFNENPEKLIDLIESKASCSINNITSFNLALDEVQKCPAIFESVKQIYDILKYKIRIVMTGSSSLDISKNITESLAGRIYQLKVNTLSLKESFALSLDKNPSLSSAFFEALLNGTLSLNILDKHYKENKYKKDESLKWINKQLYSTSFPEPSNYLEENYITWIVDYIDTYLEKDVRDLDSIPNLNNYRKLMIQCATRISSLVNYSNLGKDISMDQRTVKKYLAYLTNSYVLKELPAYSLSVSSTQKKSPKIYYCDNGLILGLLKFPTKEIAESSGLSGNLFENLIINEFYKNSTSLKFPSSFSYWQINSKQEVDLVSEYRGMSVPIEIKLSSTFSNKQLSGVNSFINKFKEKNTIKIPYGAVIYNGEKPLYINNVYIIPAWFFCI